MKKHFPLLVLLSMLACTPEVTPGGDDGKTQYLSSFTAQLPSYSKATARLADGVVTWESGDSVSVQNGVESSIFIYDEGSGTFKTDHPLEYTDGFCAVYPASIVDKVVINGFKVTLPREQEYVAGAVKGAPMWAFSDKAEFVFENLCAILEVDVQTDDPFLQLTFASNSVPTCGAGSVISGRLDLNPESDNSVSVSVPEGALKDRTLPVYVYVPAQSYPEGFTVQMEYESGVVLTERTDNSVTLSPGTITLHEAFNSLHFSGGDGSITNPWQISSVEDLRLLSENSCDPALPYSKSYYRQTCDIDFGGRDFTAICRSLEFTGTYDGGGHKLSNLSIVNPEDKPLGLFALLGNTGVVTDVVLDNASVISTRTRTGGIVGYANGGTIQNCRVGENCVIEQKTPKAHELGGIVGSTIGGTTISNCSSSASIHGVCGNVGGIAGTINGTAVIDGCSSDSKCTVEGGSKSPDSGCNVAGIVGYVSGAESHYSSAVVRNCVSSASVTGHYCDNGGIVGRLNNGSVSNCSFYGTVTCDMDDSSFTMATGTAHSNTGGIVGWVSGSYTTLYDCTSEATVKGTRCVGGILGFANSGNIHDCTVTGGSVEGVAYTGGIAGCLYNYGVSACKINNTTVTSTDGYGGGIAGYNYACMISDCHYGTGCKLLGGGRGKHRYGGIAGESYGYAAIVRECTVAGEVVPTGGIVGGAVGYLDYGLVCNTVLKATAKVSSTEFNIIGGMVGQSSSNCGYVHDCCTESGARIYGISTCLYLGGMVGYMSGPGQVFNCYVNTDITTGTPSGGIVGLLSGSSVLIANCLYYDGNLSCASSSALCGGIVGQISSSSASNKLVNCAAYPATAGTGVAGICPSPGVAVLTNNSNSVDGGAEATLAALNDGAAAYNNDPMYSVRASSWVLGTNGKPVQSDSPIATKGSGTGKTRVGLMGDSISTFTGWTPYPRGNGYPLAKWPDVTTVDQVYWHILIYEKMKDCELDVNTAYSGSCVMETTAYGYPGRGFLHRYTDLKNPDIILINGGTNDCMYGGQSLPMGKLNFDLPDEQLNLYTLAGAYDMLVRRLKAKFPEAKIALICGDYPNRNRPEGKQIILDIAEHYGLPCAVVSFPNLADYTEDDLHPNAVGHKFMADTIWSQLEGKL